LIRSYILLLLITFVELLFGFWILKIDHPFAIAATVALIDLLPVLGVGLVLVPWSVLALIQNNFTLAIGLVTLFIEIEIVRNILEPKIIGKQTGLSPILSLAAMFVGFRLFGFIGVIAVPIMIIVLKKLNEAEMIHIFR
jgi:predicted PurR-regulated permease PerM